MRQFRQHLLPAPLAISLVTALTVGCVVAGSRAKDTMTQNRGTEPIVPQSFEASIGGFFGPSYGVELFGDGDLLYLHNQETFTTAPGTVETTIPVTAEQWRVFRKALDDAHVWDWGEEYTDPDVDDGTQWRMRVEYADISVDSYGSNAYPPERDFERFRCAVVELLGGRDFQ